MYIKAKIIILIYLIYMDKEGYFSKENNNYKNKTIEISTNIQNENKLLENINILEMESKKIRFDKIKFNKGYKEDICFNLYYDKDIGFDKNEIMNQIKELDMDFDVETDDEQICNAKKKVCNKLKQSMKILGNPNYLLK